MLFLAQAAREPSVQPSELRTMDCRQLVANEEQREDDCPSTVNMNLPGKMPLSCQLDMQDCHHCRISRIWLAI